MVRSKVDEIELETIKNLWNKYGTILVSILLIVAIAFAGWKYWSSHEQKKLASASVSYQLMLEQNLANNDGSKTAEIIAQGNTIMNNYPKTVYASFAALMLASAYVLENKLPAAENSLEWVHKNSKSPILKIIATERLSRIYIANKNGEKALSILKESDMNKVDKSFKPMIYMLQSEANYQLGHKEKAKSLLQQAIGMLNSKNELAFKNYLTMKLSNLSISAENK